MTLEQIASDTHINLRHLQNIEEGRYGDLPGGIYNRAFLRAYCESINIDPTEIIARYEEQEEPSSGEKRPRIREQVHPLSISFNVHPLVIWSLMLLISATGLYWGRKRIAEIFSPYFSHPSVPGNGYQGLTPALPSGFPVTETPAASARASLGFAESPAQMASVSEYEGEATYSMQCAGRKAAH